MDEDRTADHALAWKLRQDGLTVRAVAEQLGIGVGTAHRWIREASDAEQVVGDPDDRRTARVREAAALNEWADAGEQCYLAEPTPEWLRALTALSARRSRLLGLDAPTRIAVEGPALVGPEDTITAAVLDAREQNEARRAALERPGPSPTGSDDRPPAGP